MVAYNSDELVSSSECARDFNRYISKIKDHRVDKLAVLKNDDIEAVIISKDDYEKMQDALRFQQMLELEKNLSEALEEAELIKKGKKEAYPIETLWDEL